MYKEFNGIKQKKLVSANYQLVYHSSLNMANINVTLIKNIQK